MIRVSSGSFGIEFDRRLTRNEKASSAKTKAAVRVMSISPRPQTRLLLWIGFGGLLGLLGFAGSSLLGLTWADPVGALVIAAVMAREGWSHR